MDLKPVEEQVIVITGASSGIGLATAQAAAQRGATVVLAARSIDTLERICKDIEGAGGRAIAVEVDVGRREDVERLAQTVIDRFGRIDTWINNAGVAIYGRLDQVSEEDSRRLFDTNFWGVVNGSLAALPHLRTQGGALINVGSEVSDAVVPLQGMYSASKHAVKGFTDALRIEVEELDDAPVSITLIQPTASPSSRRRRSSLRRWPTPSSGPPPRPSATSAWAPCPSSTPSPRRSCRRQRTRCGRSRPTASSTTSCRAIRTARYGSLAARGGCTAAAGTSSEADPARQPDRPNPSFLSSACSARSLRRRVSTTDTW